MEVQSSEGLEQSAFAPSKVIQTSVQWEHNVQLKNHPEQQLTGYVNLKSNPDVPSAIVINQEKLPVEELSILNAGSLHACQNQYVDQQVQKTSDSPSSTRHCVPSTNCYNEQDDDDKCEKCVQEALTIAESALTCKFMRTHMSPMITKLHILQFNKRSRFIWSEQPPIGWNPNIPFRDPNNGKLCKPKEPICDSNNNESDKQKELNCITNNTKSDKQKKATKEELLLMFKEAKRLLIESLHLRLQDSVEVVDHTLSSRSHDDIKVSVECDTIPSDEFYGESQKFPSDNLESKPHNITNSSESFTASDALPHQASDDHDSPDDLIYPKEYDKEVFSEFTSLSESVLNEINNIVITSLCKEDESKVRLEVTTGHLNDLSLHSTQVLQQQHQLVASGGRLVQDVDVSRVVQAPASLVQTKVTHPKTQNQEKSCKRKLATDVAAVDLQVPNASNKRRRQITSATKLTTMTNGRAMMTQSVNELLLYCVCRKPYDQTKFYIGCDQCQDWYHGSCVGIAEADANSIESYVCQRCKQQNSPDHALNQKVLSDRSYKDLQRVLKDLKNFEMSWPFHKPVDVRKVPDYLTVIKEPMDLSTVEKKLTSFKYSRFGEFVRDVMLIFDNCRKYNLKISVYYECAESSEAHFLQLLQRTKEILAQS